MSNIDLEFEYTTDEDSLREKDWAAGSQEPMETSECIITQDSVSFQRLIYSPQLLKMLDEAIVNILDHAVKCRAFGKTPVKTANISFDIITGECVVQNDGDGIPAVLHPQASRLLGKQIYVPTLIFGYLRQGSNRKNDTLPVGGTNGMGIKITNYLSERFRLDTICANQIFTQHWQGTQDSASAPVIKATREKPYTRLTFLPNYSRFTSITDPETKRVLQSFTLNETLQTFNAVLRSRCSMAAAFARHAIPGLTIKYNGQALTDTLQTIVERLFPEAPICKCTIDGKYPIEVVIATHPHKHHHISNINGIIVSDGPHFAKLIKQISTWVKDKVAKQLSNDKAKLPPNFVKNNIFIAINMQMIKPGWTGQRKDTLSVDTKRLSELVLPDKVLNQIGKHLIELATIGAITKAPRAQAKKAPIIDESDYRPAEWAGKANSLQCRLFAAEGKSAKTSTINGLSSGPGLQRYGVYCLGGVIINTMKETKEIHVGAETILKQTGKLEKNKFMNQFMQITGLDFNNKYDPDSTSYKREMAQLNYGGIIAMVDQDLDGRGFILPLLMAMFHTFWPNLLKAGYLQWFCSDIIKLFPIRGGKVLAYWSETSFEAVKPSLDLSKYKLQYYKGLAKHTDREMAAMFRNIDERLITFGIGAECDRLFEVYYGKIPDLRKEVLSKPMPTLSALTISQQLSTKRALCGDHLQIEGHAFQVDNLARKLDHMIDGQNQAGRKIIHGAILYFLKNGNEQVRVAQLGGAITESECYHHGEDSLFRTISNRMGTFCGNRQMSIFSNRGCAGTRLEGGDDAGAPRYLEVCLNTQFALLIYNPENNPLLQYNWDGDKRLEPKFYVPPIPIAVCESGMNPAHGWKREQWARDIFDVIKAVRHLIHNPNARPPKLRPTRYTGAPYEWRGEFRTIRGQEYSFGVYKRYFIDNKHLIEITELPLRVWTTPYITDLRKLQEKYEFIEDIHNKSDSHRVLIHIVLSPNALDRIAGCGDSIYTDDIEEFFKLRKSMRPHLNLIGLNDEVREFHKYEEILVEWFPVCKDMYRQRIERKVAILNVQLKVKQAKLRYIQANYEMRGRKRADMDLFLTNQFFPRVNEKLASNPGFIPTNQIEQAVFDSQASYSYLLNISDGNKSQEKIVKLQEKIHKLQSELDQINATTQRDPFIGASTWLSELEQLESLIREGNRTSWQFEFADKYEF